MDLACNIHMCVVGIMAQDCRNGAKLCGVVPTLFGCHLWILSLNVLIFILNFLPLSTVVYGKEVFMYKILVMLHSTIISQQMVLYCLQMQFIPQP